MTIVCVITEQQADSDKSQDEAKTETSETTKGIHTYVYPSRG